MNLRRRTIAMARRPGAALPPRRVDDDYPQELRWHYDRRDPSGQALGQALAEARRDLAAWLAKWSGKYAKLAAWVENNINEALKLLSVAAPAS
jgi:transposase-like protein